ncbi:uncharacterized protein PG986_010186 [Apiospora aurea]|uniref:Uncharacterized protein n=1 Tax=Apiospora aurea TaxID=335848 RepID=A0ABR1QA31_9PEZI
MRGPALAVRAPLVGTPRQMPQLRVRVEPVRRRAQHLPPDLVRRVQLGELVFAQQGDRQLQPSLEGKPVLAVQCPVILPLVLLHSSSCPPKPTRGGADIAKVPHDHGAPRRVSLLVSAQPQLAASGLAVSKVLYRRFRMPHEIAQRIGVVEAGVGTQQLVVRLGRPGQGGLEFLYMSIWTCRASISETAPSKCFPVPAQYRRGVDLQRQCPLHVRSAHDGAIWVGVTGRDVRRRGLHRGGTERLLQVLEAEFAA